MLEEFSPEFHSLSSPLIGLGELLQPWGLDGAIAVRLYNASQSKGDLADFIAYGSVIVAMQTELNVGDKIGNKSQRYTIEWVKRISKRIVLKFGDVDGIDAAQALRGGKLWLPRNEVVKDDSDALLLSDLIGMKIHLFTAGKTDALRKIDLGVIFAYYEAGSDGVFEINLSLPALAGKDVMIPASLEYLVDINLAEKTVCLKNYEQLLIPQLVFES